MSGPQTPRRPAAESGAPGRPARASSGGRPTPGTRGADGVPEIKRPRTVKMNPVVTIALFVTPVVLAGVLVVLYLNKPKPADIIVDRPPEPEPDDEYTKIRKEIPRVERLKQAALALKESDDQAAFKKKTEEALAEITKLIGRLDLILDPVRDEDGQLPDDYAGYEMVHKQLRTMSHDILKSSSF